MKTRVLRAVLLAQALAGVGCANVLGIAAYENGEGGDASLADAGFEAGEEVASDGASGARPDSTRGDAADVEGVDSLVSDTFVADSLATDASTCVGGALCSTNPDACKTGKTTCATGAVQCVDDAPKSAGASCPGGVCNGAGTCNACSSGASCTTNPNVCKSGKTDCSTGFATCVDQFIRPAGTLCPEGACDGAGACKCVEGSKRCKSGTTNTPQTCTGGAWVDAAVCSGGTPTCSAGACTDVVPPLSCAVAGPGRTDCGAGAESCCTSLLVTGVTTASFSRSYDGMTSGYTDPQYKAQVSDFRLDKYEITVGRFRPYVAAVVGGWKPKPGDGKHAHLNGGAGLNGGMESGWNAAWNTATNFATSSATWDTNLACDMKYQTWTSTAGVNEKKPINCLTWYDAAAFCIWDGGFLPSEAEWNYAAAGGTEQRRYPWGSTDPGPDATLAVYDCYYGGSGACSGVANIAPVGTAAAGNGKYGLSDLAGNVWEWVLDWSKTPYNETLCTNCAYVTTGSLRVIRGGGFGSGASGLLAGFRADFTPTERYSNVGARCARTPGAP
jgi:sulfatase modifying factor 1